MGALATITNLASGGLLDGVAKVIGVLKGKNSPEALAAAAQLEQMQNQFSSEFQLAQIQQVTAQIEVDKTEAASSSTFVAGWRPFIGWICGIGLGYQFIGRPIFQAITDMAGKHVAWQALDIGTLLTLLGGMLGFGAMRSYDKSQGTANGQ